jgi:hypothetical protein
MPCGDDRSEYIDKEEHRILVRAACQFCALLEHDEYELPDYLKEWWERHKKADEAKASFIVKDMPRKCNKTIHTSV